MTRLALAATLVLVTGLSACANVTGPDAFDLVCNGPHRRDTILYHHANDPIRLLVCTADGWTAAPID